MRTGIILVAVYFLLSSSCYLLASERPVGSVRDSDQGRAETSEETFPDTCLRLREKIAERGIDMTLSTTQIYQQNVHGGLSTKDRSGRYTGSYDLKVGADLEKLFGLDGASIFVHTEGSWPRAEGISEESVGSYFSVNDDAGGNRSIDVTELWYEQTLFEGILTLRFGKMDLTGGFECRGCPVSFDGCAFANDENSQFLNGALVNNPTIPFPDYAIGTTVYYNPIEWWYASIGAVDAQADARETGFNTAFHNEDNFFYVLETGVTPRIDSSEGKLQGAYRLGVWYDPQEKEKFSGNGTKRDDTGIYLSFDQMVCLENADTEDDQGLGIFGRYGWNDSQAGPGEELTNFWSVGLQYTGLFPERDEDTIAFATAQGIFSDEADQAEDSETVMELYYNIKFANWVNLTPSLQYIANPSGDASAGDAMVVGVRLQTIF